MKTVAELNLSKTQVRKNSLNLAQIVQSSPDPCHMITSARTQPLSSFILQPERGCKELCRKQCVEFLKIEHIVSKNQTEFLKLNFLKVGLHCITLVMYLVKCPIYR